MTISFEEMCKPIFGFLHILQP